MIMAGVVMLVAALVSYFYAKVSKQSVDNKKAVSQMLIGAGMLVFGIVGNFIPMIKLLFGGNRLIFTDVALFGGIGMIVYAAILFILAKVKKEAVSYGKLAKWAVVGLLLAMGTMIAPVRAIYQSLRLPACVYAIILVFCFFNNWILSTRLGQNMRTVGQNRAVATSDGIDVDKTRIIATCISTVLAAWGQLIFLQNLGTFNTVQQQTNVGLYSIAAILVGGATVQKANNKHAIVGVILFHALFVVAPLAATKLIGDSAVSEYIRMFISYGVIAVSLALHAWQTVAKKESK